MANLPGHELAPTRKPGAPLIVTAQLPPDVFAWADGLRRAHFPPERNRLHAHVTLFHALPPSVEDELVRLLKDLAAAPPPEAVVERLMNLGSGTALAIRSEAMVALHAEIAERMHGLLSSQDAQPLRLHVTIQNKVTASEARALRAELEPQFHPRRFRFAGFALHAYEDGLWRPLREMKFRGRG